MLQQRHTLIGMGLLVLLFIFVGCSSNPMTSTEYLPVAGDTQSEGDNAEAEPVDTDGTSTGTPATITTDVPKWDQDDNEEVLPVYPI